MNNNENDIREMPYAEWLEGALRRISVTTWRPVAYSYKAVRSSDV